MSLFSSIVSLHGPRISLHGPIESFQSSWLFTLKRMLEKKKLDLSIILFQAPIIISAQAAIINHTLFNALLHKEELKYAPPQDPAFDLDADPLAFHFGRIRIQLLRMMLIRIRNRIQGNFYVTIETKC